jgi:hypothetical protein
MLIDSTPVVVFGAKGYVYDFDEGRTLSGVLVCEVLETFF